MTATEVQNEAEVPSVQLTRHHLGNMEKEGILLYDEQTRLYVFAHEVFYNSFVLITLFHLAQSCMRIVSSMMDYRIVDAGQEIDLTLHVLELILRSFKYIDPEKEEFG